MINIYIDENLSPYLAKGLDTLESPLQEGFKVLSIKDVFGTGAKDEEWIPKVGKENGVVITQDVNIQRLRHQRLLYEEHGVGVFFLSPPSKNGYTYWEMVEQIIKRWKDIKKKCKNERPFAFRCSARTDFDRI